MLKRETGGSVPNKRSQDLISGWRVPSGAWHPFPKEGLHAFRLSGQGDPSKGGRQHSWILDVDGLAEALIVGQVLAVEDIADQ